MKRIIKYVFLNIKFTFSAYEKTCRYLIYLIYFIDWGQPNWEAIKRKSRKNTNLFTSWKF